MCGIFAYAGKDEAKKEVFNGLKKLDYRGHDSWGLTTLSEGELFTFKKVGGIKAVPELSKIPSSAIAIGHTRWATHGAVSEVNAHPHYSSDRSFVLVHNGIVENFSVLKERLGKKGFKFYSQTDTEVIVRLIELKKRKHGSLLKSVREAFKLLDGRNTIVILSVDAEIIAARNGSPLVVGFTSDNGEIYFSSDTLSFSGKARKILVLDNGDLFYYKDRKTELYGIASGKRKKIVKESAFNLSDRIDKEGFKHFMLKEIYDTPEAIRQITGSDPEKMKELAGELIKAANIYLIGSGTAGNAAAQIAYYLRTIGRTQAISLVGAESQSYFDLFGPGDIIIAVSQSGETADVLEVLEKAKSKKVKIASLVNMPGSMISRMSDYKFMANAGPEIAVLSTKVFVSQISWGYLLAKTVGNKYKEGLSDLEKLSDLTGKYLNDKKFQIKLKKIAKKLINSPHIFLLGKSQNLHIVREGMIKIIEGTYLHAHAVPAGDLKHYAITIMDKGIPVIFSLSDDSAWSDCINAVNQVKARGARVIAISPRNYEKFDDLILTPQIGEADAIFHIIPLQLLAYYMSQVLGYDVDKPRNIAKSVTVK